MSDDQRARVRETTVRRGDRRVAGYYEQSVGRPGGSSHDLASLLGSLAGLQVSGLIEGGTLRLSFGDLRSIAGGDGLVAFDERRIEIIDLLARIRPLGAAEIIAFESPDGDNFAFRIDSLLADRDAHLEIGRCDQDGVPDWRVPIVLHGANMPTGRSIEVAGLVVTTFAEFLDGPSGSRRPT